VDPAAIEDTHVHAFDPFASGQTARAEPRTKANEHATDEDKSTSRESISAAALDRPVKAPELASNKAEAAKTPPPTASESVAPTPKIAATPEPTPATAEVSTEPVPVTATVEVASVDAKTAPAEAASVIAEVAPTAPAPDAVQAEPAAAPPPALAEPEVPAAPEAPPSIVAAKLMAGASAAAVQAAEPRSTAPLRILVTRRTQRDRIIGVQQILSEMGYLMPQDFDGTLGKSTVSAIKDFQKENGLPETGAFTDELVTKVYAVAGKGEPPVGHLFVRQEFGSVFDAPVSFKDPETPLGTHLFTAMNFAPGDTKTQWMAISLQGDDAAGALDRLEIPNDLRQKISERLTPGSSLIIGDTAINSASLPKGADFLVWAKDTPSKITAASVNDSASEPRPKRKKSRTVRRRSFDYSYTPPRSFGRSSPWPW
jgi:peptidoglycan hydrolase-like protein with peptidoglycan-binding domain